MKGNRKGAIIAPFFLADLVFFSLVASWSGMHWGQFAVS